MEPAGKRYILHGSRTDWISIYNFADLHLFNRGCARKRLERDLDALKNDPLAFWVGGGDYTEAISVSDKRWDADAVSEDLQISDLSRLGRVQTEAVAKLFEPVRHKCLGLLLGNHEKVYQKVKEQGDLHGWLCTHLDVPNLGYSAIFDVVFVRMPRLKTPRLVWKAPDKSERNQTRTVRIMAHHGSGYATTPGGKLNKLIQFMQNFDADLFYCAHVHDQKAQRLVRIGANADCTELVEQQRLGLITGSYLRTYAKGVTTYGEQKGYAPVPLGASCVRIKPDTGEMKSEI